MWAEALFLIPDGHMKQCYTHSVDKMKLDGENIPHTGSAFKTSSLANDASKAILITRAPNIWYTHNTNSLHDEPLKYGLCKIHKTVCTMKT